MEWMKGMAYSAFASYSTKDSNLFQITHIANGLIQYPEIEKVFAWEDDAKRSIIEYMNEKIEQCDVLLLFCSQNALNSKYVKIEWETALRIGRDIIPIYQDTEYIPTLLKRIRGIEFERTNLPKMIEMIYQLILKVLEPPQNPCTPREPQNAPIDPIERQMKYYINLGTRFLNLRQYKKALSNFRVARGYSERLCDDKLTFELENRIKKIEKIISDNTLVAFRNQRLLFRELKILGDIDTLVRENNPGNSYIFGQPFEFSSQRGHVIKIDLKRKNLKSFPMSIVALPALQELDISYNKFTSLPESILQMTHLKFLNVSGNPLDKQSKKMIKKFKKNKIFVVSKTPEEEGIFRHV